MNKKGFTLVELSIVLVIIGLLIGGILVGQSLISSSKTQAFVRQVGQFDSAVASFKSKYGQLPGDNNLMGDLAAEGLVGTLGDGIIDDGFGGGYHHYGVGQFWHDLGIAGLKTEDGITFIDNSYNSGTADASINLPKAKLGQNAKFSVFGTSSGNYYIVSNIEFPDGAEYVLADAFVPADVLAVDTKMDDSIANAGNVLAVDTLTIPSIQAASGGLTTVTDCTTTAGGAIYAVSQNTETCSIRIRIGTTLGVLY